MYFFVQRGLQSNQAVLIIFLLKISVRGKASGKYVTYRRMAIIKALIYNKISMQAFRPGLNSCGPIIILSAKVMHSMVSQHIFIVLKQITHDIQ
jgi:hypothetical protein